MLQYRAVALQLKCRLVNFAGDNVSPVVLPEHTFTKFPLKASVDPSGIFLEVFCLRPDQQSAT